MGFYPLWQDVLPHVGEWNKTCMSLEAYWFRAAWQHAGFTLLFAALSKESRYDMLVLGLLVYQGSRLIAALFMTDPEQQKSLGRCLFTWHILASTLLLCFPPWFRRVACFPIALVLIKTLRLHAGYDAVHHAYIR